MRYLIPPQSTTPLSGIARAPPQNILIPEYHQYYWMGLYLNGSMGWAWVDPTAPGPEGVYAKWGTTAEGNQRPFNQQYQCAGGNWSESVGDKNTVVWGWAEDDCGVEHTFLCRKPSIGWAETMTTQSTNVTFYLNTQPSTYDEAQTACRKVGGNIAIYTSAEEQAEVSLAAASRGRHGQVVARSAACRLVAQCRCLCMT
jgi:hypothetical protein